MIVERRRFKRFDIPLDAKFKPSKNLSEYIAGIVKNFSREGLCLESQIFDFKLNETVELIVKLPDKDTFVPVVGDLMWQEQINTKCLTGIKFKEINNEAKSDILDYAYGMWVDKEKS